MESPSSRGSTSTAKTAKASVPAVPLSSIRGPLPHLRIVPTGGVDVTTAGEFIKAGCVAVAAGSTPVSKDILKTKDWAKLTDLAAQFIAAVAKARGK